MNEHTYADIITTKGLSVLHRISQSAIAAFLREHTVTRRLP